jgi:hypothetical protein
MAFHKRCLLSVSLDVADKQPVVMGLPEGKEKFLTSEN